MSWGSSCHREAAPSSHSPIAFPDALLCPVWALPAHSLSPMMSLSQSSHTWWLRLFSFSSCSILRGSARGSRPWRSNNALNWSLPRKFAFHRVHFHRVWDRTGVLSSAAQRTGGNVQLRQQTSTAARKCQGWACEQPALLQGETVCQVRGPGDHREASQCQAQLPSTWMKLSTISRAGFSTSSSHRWRSDTSKP